MVQTKDYQLRFADDLARQCVTAGTPWTQIPVWLLESLVADARTLRDMDSLLDAAANVRDLFEDHPFMDAKGVALDVLGEEVHKYRG